jgi:hypothetical protein
MSAEMFATAIARAPTGGLALASDPSGSTRSDGVQEAVAAFHTRVAPRILVTGFVIGAVFLLFHVLIPSDRPPTSGQPPQCRLAIDDVVIVPEQGRIALDIRVRNTGSSILNLTRAEVHILERVYLQIPSHITRDYNVAIEGNFISIKGAHNSTPISQAVPKDDVDRFVLHLGFLDDQPCGFKAEVILMYNGECVAVSKPIDFSTLRQR